MPYRLRTCRTDFADFSPPRRLLMPILMTLMRAQLIILPCADIDYFVMLLPLMAAAADAMLLFHVFMPKMLLRRRRS